MRRSGIGRPALEALATSGALGDLGAPARPASSGRRQATEDRVLSPAARRSGRRVRRPRPARTASRAPWSGPMPRRFPRWTRSRRCQPICRLSGCLRARRPMSFARRSSLRRGVVPNAELVKCARRGQGPRRRRGDPSATAGHGRGDDVSQPGGRDRARERHLLAGMLDPLPQGGALGGGAARPGRLERGEGADPLAPSSSNVVAEYLEEIDFAMAVGPSRDFH